MKNPRQKFDKQIADIQDHYDNGRLGKNECVNILKMHEKEMYKSLNAIKQRKVAFKARMVKKRALKAIKRKKEKVTRVIENSIGTIKPMSNTVFFHPIENMKNTVLHVCKADISGREDGRGHLRASL